MPIVVKSFKSDFLHSLQLPKKIEIRMPPEILAGAAVPQPVEEMQAISHTTTDEDHPPTRGESPVVFSRQTPDEAAAREFHQPSAFEEREETVSDSRTDSAEETVGGNHQRVRVISLEELQAHRVSKSREWL